MQPTELNIQTASPLLSNGDWRTVIELDEDTCRFKKVVEGSLLATKKGGGTVLATGSLKLNKSNWRMENHTDMRQP